MHSQPPTERDHTETEQLLVHSFHLCRSLNINRLLVQVDHLGDMARLNQYRKTERPIGWISMKDFSLPKELKGKDMVIRIPESPLTRISQMRIGLFLGLAEGFLQPNASVVSLSGVFGSQRLDTIMFLNPSRDFPWYAKQAEALANQTTSPRLMEHVISCALRLANEGREGRPIGTIMIVGNQVELASVTHQLILNPLEGHPKQHRSIFNPEFFETLRELAALDGAFIVDPSGAVVSAGTFLSGPGDTLRLPAGLGARHAAACSITALSKNTMAVVVSESSGTVTIFHGGSPLLKLEKMAPERLTKTFVKEKT